MFILVSDALQIPLNSCFSDGDFVEISTGRRAVHESATSLEDENDDANEGKGNLFTCPVEGCVKLFQRYSSLENHLQYGTCNIVPERECLFDMARIIYKDKLLHGSGIQPLLVSSTIPASAEEIKPQGWH